MTGKVVRLMHVDPNEPDDEGRAVGQDTTGVLLPDGRLYIEGAGVDGGAALFAGLVAYQPNGTAVLVGHQLTGEVQGVGLEDLASGDVDNLVYNHASLLTPLEQDEVRALAGTDIDRGQAQRWVDAATTAGVR
jgi:hypothetical protein